MLGKDGRVFEKVWKSDQNHGRELMPAVFEVLEQASLLMQDVTQLAVALGPGGFSAVRVGISAVIGLAMPRELPVAGVPTHAIEAEQYFADASAASPVLSVIPAGRSELAWARFDSPSPQPAAIGLSGLPELVATLGEEARICGEAAELLAGKVPPEMIIGRQPPTRKPSSLIALAQRQFAEHGPTEPTLLRPIYARPPSITEPNRPV